MSHPQARPYYTARSRWVLSPTAMLAAPLALLVGCRVDAPVARFGADGGTRDGAVSGATVYVSSTMGDDASSGTTEDEPVRTLERAMALVRGGGYVAVRLRRGERFLGSFGRITVSGADASRPFVIGTYGSAEGRPLVDSGAEPALSTESGDAVRFLSVEGIELVAGSRDPTQPGASGTGLPLVDWQGGGGELRFDDCLFRYAGVHLWPAGSDERVVRVTFSRCLFLDAYDVAAPTSTQRARGLHLGRADGVTVSECIFDHNGWYAVPGAEPDLVSHNLFADNGSGSDLRIERSLFLRAASHGAQMRAGGTATGNLFVRNPISLSIGGGDDPEPGGVTGSVTDNVFLEGNDILPRPPEILTGEVLRGGAIDLENIRSAVVSSNLLARCIGGFCRSIPVTSGVTYTGNTVSWGGGGGAEFLPDSPGPFADPLRSVETYQASLGRTATFEAFVAALRQQSSRRWDPAYEAEAIAAYLRDGFRAP